MIFFLVLATISWIISGFMLLTFLINLFIGEIYTEPLIIFLITEIISILLYITYKKIDKHKKEEERNRIYIEQQKRLIEQQKQYPAEPIKTYTYEKKKLITACESKFGAAISNALPAWLHLQPQIPLHSIIDKIGGRNSYELNRIIDFGVFDNHLDVVMLIEINDSTHKQPERIKRDKEVKEICKEANIPLITLWTEYGVDEDYIKWKIQQTIDKYYHY